MVRSTARHGAMTVRDKKGRLLQPARPIGTEIPMSKMRWLLRQRTDPMFGAHECDFSPVFDGSRVTVCACGRTQGGEI